MRNKLGGDIMKEFVRLHPKMYSGTKIGFISICGNFTCYISP